MPGRRTLQLLALIVTVTLVISGCGGAEAPTATPGAPAASPTATRAADGPGGTPAPTPTATTAPVDPNIPPVYSAERTKELLSQGYLLPGMQRGRGEQVQTGGTLVSSTRGDLPSDDPMVSSGISSVNLLATLYGNGNLVRPKRSNVFEIEPHLAESWTANADFTAWTFKLRPGVLWHDGTKLTAPDIKFWIDLARFPPQGRRVAFASVFPSMTEVQVVDDMTVRLLFNQSSPHFFETLSKPGDNLTHPRHLVQPHLDKGNVRVGLNEIGWVATGPFKFDRWDKGARFQVVRFDKYWEKDEQGRTLPYLDAVQFPIIPDPTVAVSAFRAGRIDATSRGTGHHLTPDMVDSIKRSLAERAYYMRFPYLGWGLSLNAQKPPFDDLRVRQAVNLWTDREEGAKLIWAGFAVPSGILAPGSYWANPEIKTWPGYNQATKAKDRADGQRLLKDSGYAGTEVVISCRDFYLKSCEFADLELRALGFKVRIDIMDTNRLSEVTSNGRHQINMSPTTAPEPGSLLPGFVTTNPLNGHKHGDTKIDDYAALSSKTLDPMQRRKVLWEAEKYIIFDKVYVSYWFWEEGVVGYRTYVKGVWTPGHQVQHGTDRAYHWIDKSMR